MVVKHKPPLPRGELPSSAWKPEPCRVWGVKVLVPSSGREQLLCPGVCWSVKSMSMTWDPAGLPQPPPTEHLCVFSLVIQPGQDFDSCFPQFGVPVPGTVARVCGQSLMSQSRVWCPRAVWCPKAGAVARVLDQRMVFQSRAWCPKAGDNDSCFGAELGVPEQNFLSQARDHHSCFGAEIGVPEPGTVVHVCEQSFMSQSQGQWLMSQIRVLCLRARACISEQSLVSQSW